MLSDLTNYTSIVLGPRLSENHLKQIQIVPIQPKKAVAILVTNTGHVENKTINFPAEVDLSDLEKLVNILNERLSRRADLRTERQDFQRSCHLPEDAHSKLRYDICTRSAQRWIHLLKPTGCFSAARLIC